MALTRISRVTVKKLVVAALDAALSTELRLHSELDGASPDSTESERRFKVRSMALTPRVRQRGDNEPDVAELRLEVLVFASPILVAAEGDDALDIAVDLACAALDHPIALIDSDRTTRVEFNRAASADQPPGENDAAASSLITVTGTVFKTPNAIP